MGMESLLGCSMMGGGQPVTRAARMMTAATAPGSEIMDRCGALISVTCAPALRAMLSCSASGITWSAVPMTAQDGMDFHAGVPEGSVSVLAASGRWVAASTPALAAGRPLAKQPGKTLCLTYKSASPDGAPGKGTKLNTAVAGLTARQDPGSALVSPSRVSVAPGM